MGPNAEYFHEKLVSIYYDPTVIIVATRKLILFASFL